VTNIFHNKGRQKIEVKNVTHLEEPGVAEALLGGGPGGRLEQQQAADEGARALRHAGPELVRVAEVDGDDVRRRLLGRVVQEGRHAAEECVEDGAHAPHVAGAAGALPPALHHLRRAELDARRLHVGRRDEAVGQRRVVLVHRLRVAQVHDAQPTQTRVVRLHQNVFRLKNNTNFLDLHIFLPSFIFIVFYQSFLVFLTCAFWQKNHRRMGKIYL
jgi:hypothetical protein